MLGDNRSSASLSKALQYIKTTYDESRMYCHLISDEYPLIKNTVILLAKPKQIGKEDRCSISIIFLLN